MAKNTWYSDIPKPNGDRSPFKDNDTAIYQAVNHYQISSDLSIDKSKRSIHRSVVGDKETAILVSSLLQTNDRLDDTHYLAESDEGWTYYVELSMSATYKDIAYLQKWEAPKLDKDDKKKKKKKRKPKRRDRERRQVKTKKKKTNLSPLSSPSRAFLWVKMTAGSKSTTGRRCIPRLLIGTTFHYSRQNDELADGSSSSRSKPSQGWKRSYETSTTCPTLATASKKKGSDHVLVHLGRTMVQADRSKRSGAISQVKSQPNSSRKQSPSHVRDQF